MTRRQAIEKGYTFLGPYSRDKEEMKQRAKELTEKGYKTVIIKESGRHFNYVAHGNDGGSAWSIYGLLPFPHLRKALAKPKFITFKGIKI